MRGVLQNRVNGRLWGQRMPRVTVNKRKRKVPMDSVWSSLASMQGSRTAKGSFNLR
jgi:hypothetical protein